MQSGGGDIELAGVCKSFDGVTNVVDGVNLNGSAEQSDNIQTQLFIYQNPAAPLAAAFTSGFICFTPLGRSYIVIGPGPPSGSSPSRT